MSEAVETVYLATHRGSRGKFHTDEDCWKLNKAEYTRDVRRPTVEGRRELCSVCAGEAEQPSGTSTLEKCPRCGEDISDTDLPFHLPCDSVESN